MDCVCLKVCLCICMCTYVCVSIRIYYSLVFVFSSLPHSLSVSSLLYSLLSQPEPPLFLCLSFPFFSLPFTFSVLPYSFASSLLYSFLSQPFFPLSLCFFLPSSLVSPSVSICPLVSPLTSISIHVDPSPHSPFHPPLASLPPPIPQSHLPQHTANRTHSLFH